MTAQAPDDLSCGSGFRYALVHRQLLKVFMSLLFGHITPADKERLGLFDQLAVRSLYRHSRSLSLSDNYKNALASCQSGETGNV